MEDRLAASTIALAVFATKSQNQPMKLAQLWKVQLHSGVKILQLASPVSPILHTPVMEARLAASTIAPVESVTKNQS